jgi:hypothetical protein
MTRYYPRPPEATLVASPPHTARSPSSLQYLSRHESHRLHEVSSPAVDALNSEGPTPMRPVEAVAWVRANTTARAHDRRLLDAGWLQHSARRLYPRARRSILAGETASDEGCNGPASPADRTGALCSL